MRKITTLLLLSFLSTACATKFYLPGNKFLSPESSGDTLKGDAKIGGSGVTQVQIADDMTSASPNITPALSKNSTVALGLAVGVIDKLDVYYNSVSGAPSFAGLKYQFWGDSMPNSKSGNFSAALAGGIAFGRTRLEASTGDIESESKINFAGSEIMLLLGYKATDWALLYTGPLKSNINAKVSIDRTQAGISTTTAEPDGKGEMTGALLGVRFGTNFFLNVEAAFTEMKYTRQQPSEMEADKFSDTALGVALGGAW